MCGKKLMKAATTLLAICTAVCAARAQVVIYVDDDASLGGDGLSWETAKSYLQDALSLATAGDEIRVAGGVYRPDVDEGGGVAAIKYDATELPENILTPFIVHLASEKGLIPVEPPPGFLVEVGKARSEINRASLFVVAAELVPPPLPLPAEFQISNLSITPQRSRPSEPVTISVNVANRGEIEGSYELYLQINGIIKMTKKVTLTPKSSKEVTFEVSDLAGGVHDVRIGDLTGQFEIIKTVTRPAWQAVNWLALDLGVGAVVFISLVAIYLLRRRARRSQSR